jgi:hypothetical protein
MSQTIQSLSSFLESKGVNILEYRKKGWTPDGEDELPYELPVKFTGKISDLSELEVYGKKNNQYILMKKSGGPYSLLLYSGKLPNVYIKYISKTEYFGVPAPEDRGYDTTLDMVELVALYPNFDVLTKETSYNKNPRFNAQLKSKGVAVYLDSIIK